MIVHLPTNTTIASSLNNTDTYYLYRDSGEEVVVTVSEGKIETSSRLLNFVEVEYIQNYIIKKQVNGNRFLQIESKI